MNRKSLLTVFLAYVLWGVLPLYWKTLSNLDSFFILANRIVWALVFAVLLLLGMGKLSKMKELLTDWSKLKFILPAALFITINWATYIWSVNANRILESSLGYYMNPLAVCLCSVVIFKEKITRSQIAAILLALIGVTISTVQFGNVPFVSFTLAISFALYGVFKKLAHSGGIESVGVETLIVTPLAILFLIFAPQSHAAVAIITPREIVLCALSGVATAVPLMLYSKGVNELPFVIIGFLQYICPTLSLIIGILFGEPFAASQAISFGFIWAGLIVFSVGMILQDRRDKKVAVHTESS